MEERLPRKLAAILHADVAGYSRLAGKDEDATHRGLKSSLDLIGEAVSSCQGRVVNYAGDAALAVFDAVVRDAGGRGGCSSVQWRQGNWRPSPGPPRGGATHWLDNCGAEGEVT